MNRSDSIPREADFDKTLGFPRRKAKNEPIFWLFLVQNFKLQTREFSDHPQKNNRL